MVSFCHGKSQRTGAKQYLDTRALLARGPRGMWRRVNRSGHAAAPALGSNPTPKLPNLPFHRHRPSPQPTTYNPNTPPMLPPPPAPAFWSLVRGQTRGNFVQALAHGEWAHL